MKYLLLFLLGLVLSPIPIAADLVIVNQYGGTKSQLLEFSNGKPKTLWDIRKSGKIKSFLPLYGPVYNLGSGNLYFMESSVSKAFLHEYNIVEKTSKVIWQATKEDTRQGVYNPWSFADSMAIDQENEVIYWSGRAPGRNGATTFYRFAINKKGAQPTQLEHVSISTGRQIGQSVAYKDKLYVSSIREGLWEFPLKAGKGQLVVKKQGFEKGNVRGPALNPAKGILYFTIGSGIYSLRLRKKAIPKKIGSLDFCCSTLHGVAFSYRESALYITAQNLKGPGRKGSTLYRFDLKSGQTDKKGVPFLRTSSAAKNILVVQ